MNAMQSLEYLCLYSVTKNIERMYFAFTSGTNDKNLQKNFEFLKKKYSAPLISGLHQVEMLKDEYFELLINDYVTALNGEWFKNSRYVNCMENIFCRLPNLQRICFRHYGDEILENISKFCPKITEIHMQFSNITDNGVKYLCNKENGVVPCPQLKNFYLFPSNVTEIGVECLLRNVSSIETIDHPYLSSVLHTMHEENLSTFKEIHYYNIVELNFLDFGYNPDNFKSCLTVCPNLETIHCAVPGEEQLNAVTCSRLKNVYVKPLTDDLDINLDNFLKRSGKHLISLKICHCSVSMDILAQHCPALKEFCASEVNLIHDGDVKPRFPSLIECCFHRIDPLVNESISLLISSSPNLEYISFLSCNLSREIKRQILAWCKNTSAKKIDFWNSYLEIEFLRLILMSCPSLQAMFLCNCFFDVQMAKEHLKSLAESLPNKPEVSITTYEEFPFDNVRHKPKIFFFQIIMESLAARR